MVLLSVGLRLDLGDYNKVLEVDEDHQVDASNRLPAR